MKPILIFILFTSILRQDQFSTETITLNYTNGNVAFSVLKKNPQIDTQDGLVYHWYSKSNGLQQTKGSFSGQLLHGRFHYFSNSGKIKEEKNFKEGLFHGQHISWDTEGQIDFKMKYENGKCISFKDFKWNDEYDVEWVLNQNFVKTGNNDGPALKNKTCICASIPGCIKLVTFKDSEKIFQKVEYLNDFIERNTEYFETTGKIKIEYYYFPDFSKTKTGTYKEFYPDGTIKISGQLAPNNVWSGEFQYFSSAGTKVKSEYYINGKLK